MGGATATATHALLNGDGSVRGGGVTNTNGTVQLGDGSGTTGIATTYVQSAGSTTVVGNTGVGGLIDIDGGTLVVNSGVTFESTGGNIDIEDAGGVTLQSNAVLQSLVGNITNSDQIDAQAGAEIIAVGTITNEATGTITYANGGTLSAAAAAQGTITNQGVITVTAGTVTAAGNDNLTNEGANGQVIVNGGNLTFGSGAVTNTSTNALSIDIATGGTLTAATVTSSGAGSETEVDGSLDGNLVVQGTAFFDINGTSGAAPVEVTGNVTQSGTSALNTLAGDIGGTLSQTGAGLITVDGTSVVSGALDNNAGEVQINDGIALTVNNTTAPVAANGVDNAAGATLDVDGNLTAIGQTVANAGTAQLGDASGTSVITASTYQQTAGSTSVEGDTTVTGLVDIDAGTVSIATGEFLESNTGIDIEDAGGVTLNNNAILRTTAGNITNADQIAVGDGGEITAAGTLTNEPTGTITYANGGILSAAGAGQGTITNQGLVTVTSGTVTATGNDNLTNETATGQVVVNGGNLTFGTGVVTNTSTNALSLDINTGGTLTAATVTSSGAGSETEIDGSLDGNLVVSGTAFFDINGTSAAAPVEVTGNVTQSGTSALNTLAGDIGGMLSQTGVGMITVDGASIVSGTVTNSAGELQVDSTLTLGAALSNAGTLDVNGSILGGQTITNTGTLDLDGNITGNVVNQGVATLSGAVSGNYSQTAGTTTIDGATSLGSLQNTTGTVTANSPLTLGGASTNAGTFNMNADVLGGQTVTNTGTFVNDGSNTFTGNLNTSNVVSMTDAATNDALNITGNTQLNGTLNYDVNVSGAAVGGSGVDTGDLIAATGTVTGNTTLAFSNVGATTAALGAPIDVITGANTAGLTTALTGLPTSGVFFYELNNTGSAVQLASVSSPATGALASNIAATQGLISSVVNRPSAPVGARMPSWTPRPPPRRSPTRWT